MSNTPYRLSRYTLFINWGDEVEIRQTATGGSWRVPRTVRDRLESYAGFRDLDPQDQEWVEATVLVAPYEDAAIQPREGTEAKLAADVLDWYWRHEVESEREYKWLGWPIVKSPADIFFYQELIGSGAVRKVIELGSGDGGGLWMFATLLSAVGGGIVVGVERDPPIRRPPYEQARDVRVVEIVGDALDQAVRDRAREGCEEADLIVIDVGADLDLTVALLERWQNLCTDDGIISLEDAAGTSEIADVLENILLQNDGLRVVLSTRLLSLKSMLYRHSRGR
jgi:cephalosporin hydroxylase